MERYSPRLRGDSFVQGKMIPRCLLWCQIYPWNQTLQLYHISPGRFLDTLLEGYECTLPGEMSPPPLLRGERLHPTHSPSVHQQTGISSGSSEVSVIRRARKSAIKSNVSSQLILFQYCRLEVILGDKAPKMLPAFYGILFF